MNYYIRDGDSLYGPYPILDRALSEMSAGNQLFLEIPTRFEFSEDGVLEKVVPCEPQPAHPPRIKNASEVKFVSDPEDAGIAHIGELIEKEQERRRSLRCAICSAPISYLDEVTGGHCAACRGEYRIVGA